MSNLGVIVSLLKLHNSMEGKVILKITLASMSLAWIVIMPKLRSDYTNHYQNSKNKYLRKNNVYMHLQQNSEIIELAKVKIVNRNWP